MSTRWCDLSRTNHSSQSNYSPSSNCKHHSIVIASTEHSSQRQTYNQTNWQHILLACDVEPSPQPSKRSNQTCFSPGLPLVCCGWIDTKGMQKRGTLTKQSTLATVLARRMLRARRPLRDEPPQACLMVMGKIRTDAKMIENQRNDQNRWLSIEDLPNCHGESR